MVNFDIFWYFWYISALDGQIWMKLVTKLKSFWTESGKIFDWYDPQNFWETLEAGGKKWIFLPFWLLWSNNLGTSETENDKKSVGKLNFCSRPNHWCNRHVNRLKHIDLAKLQRSVCMIKWHFLVILVILGSKSGHFPL